MRPSAAAFAVALGLALACGKGEPPALRVVVAGPHDGPVPAEAIGVLTARAEALGAVVVEPQADGSVLIGFPGSSGSDVAGPLLRRDAFSLWVVDEHATQPATLDDVARLQATGVPVVPNASGYGEPGLVLVPPPVLTPVDVVDASAGASDDGAPHVMLTFDDAGAKRFAAVTGAHVGERLAIVADGKCVSAPVVREAITGGKARIDLGGASLQQGERDARELAAVLDSGELPVALELREVSTW